MFAPDRAVAPKKRGKFLYLFFAQVLLLLLLPYLDKRE
jgi:hypothetical protein